MTDPTFVAAATVTSAAANTATSATGNLASTTVGILNILWLNAMPVANTTDPGAPTINGQAIASSGWTLLGSSFDTGSPGVRLTAVYRVYQAGDPSSITWAWASPGNYVTGGVAYSNFDTTTPVENASFQGQVASATAFPTPSVTTTDSGLVCSLFSNRSAGTWTGLPGTSRSTGAATSSANFGYSDSGTAQAAGAQSKTGTFSVATSVGNTAIWLVKSAAAAPVATPLSTWLGAAPFTCAHRGGSDDWPEMSLYAYQQSVAWGCAALELSVWRTSDGVWAGSHDRSTLRVFGVDLDITATPWATLQTLRSTVGGQPMCRLEDVLDRWGQTRIIFVDNKQSTNVAAFFDKLDTYPGATGRFVSKSYYTDTAVTAEAHNRGYKTWGYYYQADVPNLASTQSRWDILGMDYTADAASWTAVLSYGKPVMAHIVNSAAARTTALGKGANGLMVSKVTQAVTFAPPARVVERWSGSALLPSRRDQWNGTALVQRTAVL